MIKFTNKFIIIEITLKKFNKFFVCIKIKWSRETDFNCGQFITVSEGENQDIALRSILWCRSILVQMVQMCCHTKGKWHVEGGVWWAPWTRCIFSLTPSPFSWVSSSTCHLTWEIVHFSLSLKFPSSEF